MNISVLGAGAWGTALAAALVPRRNVLLWARDAGAAQAIAATRRNARYLPETELPPELRCTSDLSEAAAHARHGLLLIAAPTAALRHLLRELHGHAPLPPIVWLCKGLEQASAAMAHEIVADELGEHPAGPLSGPSFAQEVARRLPTALVVAGRDEFCRLVTTALHDVTLRIYSTSDVVGVEVGGAVKNVMAIATGICDALELGHNARAALITRGLAETARLAVALGGKRETMMGLAGLGDLVLTCTGDLSRNRRVGLALAKGRALPAILADLGHVAEGVHAARAVRALAAKHAIDMPIAEAVDRVLHENLPVREAVAGLLRREPRPEAH